MEVQIKPLEWGNPGGYSFIDSLSLNTEFPQGYTINIREGKFEAEIQWDDCNGHFETLGTFDTPEQAREACQEHWNALILSFIVFKFLL